MSIRTTLFAIGFSFLFFACNNDWGNPVAVLSSAPMITAVTPASGSAGDTITIAGSKFGAAQGTSSVKFGSISAGNAVSWSDVSIKITVPSGAVTGNIVVTVGTKQSNGKLFTVSGTTAATVSFAGEIAPLFNAKGCANCHGGNGGLIVLPYSSLMSGSSLHGPVVTPGDGEGSTIVKKLRGTAGFGARMPQGGPYLSETEIQKFVTWINEGAHDN